jgi:hypothetical protein
MRSEEAISPYQELQKLSMNVSIAKFQHKKAQVLSQIISSLSTTVKATAIIRLTRPVK